MIPPSLPFAILILSSYLGVIKKKIVHEPQSVFALQSPFIQMEMSTGKLYQKSLFLWSV